MKSSPDPAALKAHLLLNEFRHSDYFFSEPALELDDSEPDEPEAGGEY